ncbi:Cytochrome P450 [Penicillium italicum]|uniref:Cytochrome P450 n=1 Tax=Penicillium italicum TaxID=40296 RepID=A0A0A2LGX4_PENIT|nr:Cytochrome P450 [Penicillium italicum]
MPSDTLTGLGLLTRIVYAIYYVWVRIAESRLLPGIPLVTVWNSAGFNVLPKTSSTASESEQIMGWLERKCIELDTPILQIRAGLLGKPYIVVADSLECETGVANFARAPDPPLLDALILLMWSLHIPTPPLGGPLPHKIAMRFVPRYRDALKLVRSYIDKSVKVAEKKKQHGHEKGEIESPTAVDLIVKREIELAKDQDRTPDLHTGLLRNEIFGIFFGFDVLAIMAIWGLKILTAHQDVQGKLRAELRSNFPEAAEDGRVPTAEEIATTVTPYLDAVYEEMLRCTRGRSYTHRGTKEEKKSTEDTPKDAWTGNWSPEGLSQFDPERWLIEDVDGRKRFNARAGPRHMLGTGTRACFGMKQATSVMRIFLALVVWKLELRPVPSDLGQFERAGAAFVYRAKEVYVSPQAIVQSE